MQEEESACIAVTLQCNPSPQSSAWHPDIVCFASSAATEGGALHNAPDGDGRLLARREEGKGLGRISARDEVRDEGLWGGAAGLVHSARDDCKDAVWYRRTDVSTGFG